MNKHAAIALIAIGAALMTLGISATTSVASAVTQFFTRTPTDRASWMLLGGVVFMAIGLASAWRARGNLH